MRILKKIVLFAFIGILFVTCKKEVLTPSTTVGQPVFSFNGNIGSSSLNWQAGVNNYYMYSSFSQNPNGVYAFTGTLQSTATANNSIQITINDYKVFANNASISQTHIDSSFSRPVYLYKTPGGIIDSTYSITFTPIIYAGVPTSYLYNFGDGYTSTAISPTHVYTAAGTYSTYLTVGFSTGLVSMSNPITIYKAPQPQLWINSISSTNDTVFSNVIKVNFTASISNGTAPYTYLWSFGDGSTSSTVTTYTTVIFTHTYDSIGKVYPVNLKVTDYSGRTENYNYPVWADSGRYTMGGLMDYKMTPPVQVIDSNTSTLSDVTINYTDANGNVYTSNNALQPKGSSFQIVSASAYQNNLNNNPTEMLKVTFNCMLYPVNSSSLLPIQATNCTAVIAVAY